MFIKNIKQNIFLKREFHYPIKYCILICIQIILYEIAKRDDIDANTANLVENSMHANIYSVNTDSFDSKINSYRFISAL